MGARMAAALASGVLLCACASSSNAPAQQNPDLNVTGTIDRGFTATCPAGEPCDPPAVATALVFSHDGFAPVTARVGPDGAFALHLNPGEYAIATAPPVFQGAVEPSSVRVPSGGSVSLQLRIVRSP